MSPELDQRDNYERLRQDVRRRPLVLFVGAGINGLEELSWGGLLKSLCEAALDDVFQKEHAAPKDREIVLGSLVPSATTAQIFDVYQTASLIKRLLGPRYIPVLQKAIYPDGIWDKLKRECRRPGFGEFATLFSLARFCCESQALVRAVVSFNYDSYLSTAIKLWSDAHPDCHLSTVNPFLYADNTQNPGARPLPVYHVHGYIVPPGEIQRQQGGDVVLSYDEYFQNMLEPTSWQTTTQLHFLMNFTCLFVGASLNDVNMLRMLASAKKYGVWRSPAEGEYATGRYAFIIRDDVPDGTVARIRSRLRTTVLTDAGVSPIYVSKQELCEKILEIGKVSP